MWLYEFLEDMMKMSVKRRRAKATDTGEWKRLCEAVNILQEL
jgi:hypothetical protein